jgi:hypothetical protein
VSLFFVFVFVFCFRDQIDLGEKPTIIHYHSHRGTGPVVPPSIKLASVNIASRWFLPRLNLFTHPTVRATRGSANQLMWEICG